MENKTRILSKIVLTAVLVDLSSKALAHLLLPHNDIVVANRFIEIGLVVNHSGINTQLSKIIKPDEVLQNIYCMFISALMMILMSFLISLWIKPTSATKAWIRISIFLSLVFLPLAITSLFPKPDEYASYIFYFDKVPSLILAAWGFYLVRNKILEIGFAFLLAGALGNVINQLFLQGGVTDFIGFPFIYWYMGRANVADFFVTTGEIAILFFPILYLYQKVMSKKSL